MVKAPSSSSFHQSKFKSWRRGKSTKGKHSGKTTSSSLKQQLRGLLRLRDKNPSLNEETQARIESLQNQIKERDVTERERTNATKSHKARFIERQNSMRRYKKLSNEAPRNETELYKLALDQIYIAHYPLADTSYLSLYTTAHQPKDAAQQQTTHQRRHILNARLLFKMAAQRKLALKKSQTEDAVSWVPSDQYERVKHVNEWTTELERTTFGIQEASKEAKTTKSVRKDDRFQVSEQHEELLQEAEDIDKHLENSESAEKAALTDKNEHEEDEDGSSSEDQSSSDSSSSSDDDDDSSSSSDDVIAGATPENDNRTGSNMKSTDSLVSDGFLTADTSTNVFDKAKRQEPSTKTGDKSQGWATQRQLPGEFRKRRKR